jgi:homogentisate 1,2-dioxygenase
MPLYHKLGTFLKKDIHNSKTKWRFYYEQPLEPRDFMGIPHYLYHVHRPTQVKEILKSYSVEPKIANGKTSNRCY